MFFFDTFVEPGLTWRDLWIYRQVKQKLKVVVVVVVVVVVGIKQSTRAIRSQLT